MRTYRLPCLHALKCVSVVIYYLNMIVLFACLHCLKTYFTTTYLDHLSTLLIIVTLRISLAGSLLRLNQSCYSSTKHPFSMHYISSYFSTILTLAKFITQICLNFTTTLLDHLSRCALTYFSSAHFYILFCCILTYFTSAELIMLY
jgi:hypothetical protein